MIIIKFIIGTIIGSFSSLVSIRTLRNESIISPRSHCDNCNRRLTPLEMIPIISFIILKGKCHDCKQPIGYLNLISEIIMGCICLQFSLNVNSIFTILFEWILLLISLFDVQKMIIPTKLIHLLLIIVVIQQLINFDFNLIKFSLVLLSYTIISGINQRYSWIGNGDIDIIWIILLKTNLNMSIISLFISSCLVIIFQIASKYDKKRPIPYAPFLFAAFIITNTFVKI